MKEFNSVEELRNDEDLQSLGRYSWQKVKLNGKEVFACSTDQQYEDIICSGVYEMLCNLFEHFRLFENHDTTELTTDIRDFVLGKLKEDGIEFVDVYEEY